MVVIINRTINQVQGHVDVRFEVTGSKGNTAEIHVVMRKHPPPEHQLWETVKYQVLLKDSQQKVLSTYNGFMEENTGRLQLVPKE
ncbi:hypothetical protein BKA69DRAFT_1104663 [Paraphysoderma sedebokerense]|nr:hypothetical protein BKA69DRAFT_1104663 [Paraphysoderma sedebokerense]